jgi:hypothetical protein
VSKVAVEVMCNNIMLDEKRHDDWKIEVDQSIVDAVNKMDSGDGTPRIKVTAKKKSS